MRKKTEGRKNAYRFDELSPYNGTLNMEIEVFNATNGYWIDYTTGKAAGL